MNDVEIGSYLCKRREELGISPKSLSDATNIDLGSVGKFEKGIRPLPKNLLPVIAEAYRIPFFTLISLVYEGRIPVMEKENVLPHFKRVIDSGISSFSFTDLVELLHTEQALNFIMEPEQLKAWYSKHSSIAAQK